MFEDQEYDLFYKFIETFSPIGFTGIDPQHPLMLALEKMMLKNNQFFYVGDLLQMKIIFSSKGSMQALGINPEELSPYHFFEATHPDDIYRLSLGRAKLLKMAHDLFVAGEGSSVISTNFRIRNPQGKYANLSVQLYCYYCTVPIKSVFVIKVHTNIEWFKMKKQVCHYYLGTDLSKFRYPDAELLQIGHGYSDREFEIIRMVEQGLSTEQIAGKLFISPFTVNTHRGNIISKSGKAHISDVIYDLQFRGLL